MAGARFLARMASRHVAPLPAYRPSGETCTAASPRLSGPAHDLQSYDLPWPMASTPRFRYYKHWVHEGGIRDAGVAAGPRLGLARRHRPAPLPVIDVMDTCLDAAGASYPREMRRTAITPLEGKACCRCLLGRTPARDRPLFWEHEGNSAVRDGERKLVRRHPGDWELYNLEEERTELRDRSAGERRERERLIRLYNDWSARSGVLDWPLPSPS